MKAMELIGLLLFFAGVCTVMERRGPSTTLDSLFFQVGLLGGLMVVGALVSLIVYK